MYMIFYFDKKIDDLIKIILNFQRITLIEYTHDTLETITYTLDLLIEFELCIIIEIIIYS